MKKRKKYQIETWPASSTYHAPDGWHNCDGEIVKHLSRAINPPQLFNQGKPTWFLSLIVYGGRKEMPISYCPICGEKLAMVERQPMAYGGQHE